MLKDLQARIDARAKQTANEAHHAFWKKHNQGFGNSHTLEGIELPELAKLIDPENSTLRGITNGAGIREVLSIYSELQKLAIYHNEKARLEGELVEMAEKLYGGEFESSE